MPLNKCQNCFGRGKLLKPGNFWESCIICAGKGELENSVVSPASITEQLEVLESPANECDVTFKVAIGADICSPPIGASVAASTAVTTEKKRGRPKKK